MTAPVTNTRSPRTSTLPAWLVAALGPPAAWLAWVSWADGKASDGAHVAWFVSVALTTVVAGALVPRGRLPRLTAAALAAISTLATLWLWWSTSDDSGLFVIGFVLWFFPVVLGAPALVALGAWVRGRSRSR